MSLKYEPASVPQVLRHINVAGADLTACHVIQACLNVSDYCRDPLNDNAVKSKGYPLPKLHTIYSSYTKVYSVIYDSGSVPSKSHLLSS